MASPTSIRHSARSGFRPVLFNRGRVYPVKGDTDRAIADYDEAIRLDPGLPFRVEQPRHRLPGKGEHDRAIADYNEAIRLDPKFAIALDNRGTLFAKKDYDHAIADYTEAIRLKPDYAAALFGAVLSNG